MKICIGSSIALHFIGTQSDCFLVKISGRLARSVLMRIAGSHTAIASSKIISPATIIAVLVHRLIYIPRVLARAPLLM